jgi:hypothetical protein
MFFYTSLISYVLKDNNINEGKFIYFLFIKSSFFTKKLH